MLKINQLVFIYDLIKEERMRNCHTVSTSMKARNFIEM